MYPTSGVHLLLVSFGRSLRVEVVAVWAVRTVIQFYIGDSIAENPELSRMSKRLEICLKRL